MTIVPSILNYEETLLHLLTYNNRRVSALFEGESPIPLGQIQGTITSITDLKTTKFSAHVPTHVKEQLDNSTEVFQISLADTSGNHIGKILLDQGTFIQTILSGTICMMQFMDGAITIFLEE